jgi:hypothetical protein
MQRINALKRRYRRSPETFLFSPDFYLILRMPQDSTHISSNKGWQRRECHCVTILATAQLPIRVLAGILRAVMRSGMGGALCPFILPLHFMTWPRDYFTSLRNVCLLNAKIDTSVIRSAQTYAGKKKATRTIEMRTWRKTVWKTRFGEERRMKGVCVEDGTREFKNGKWELSYTEISSLNSRLQIQTINKR